MPTLNSHCGYGLDSLLPATPLCQGYQRQVNSPLGSESETTDDNEVTHHSEDKGKHTAPEEEEPVGI